MSVRVCVLGAIQLNESAQILGVDSPQSRVGEFAL